MGDCNLLFTISGSTITAATDVSIIFAVSHHGGSGWQGTKFFPVCVNAGAGGPSVTLDCGNA